MSDVPTLRKRAQSRFRRRILLLVAGGLLSGVVGGLLAGAVLADPKWAVLTGLAACVLNQLSLTLIFLPGFRLRAAHELIEDGLGRDALPLLKDLDREGALKRRRDSACYLTARAYESCGAVKLALAYYREYGKRFPEGAWAIEAKVQARDLRRRERERKALALEARQEPDLRCPYCRDALLLEKPHVECPTCGTRYHDDCHRERGGCSVFGCASAPRAEERVSA